MKKNFTEIEFKTKPHVAHYMEYHFGKPCKIPPGHFIFEYIRLALGSKIKKDEAKITSLTASVKVFISEDEFIRYGHTINKTSAQNLSDSIDNFIRMQIRSLTDIILKNSETNEDWKKRYLELNKEHKELLNLTLLSASSETTKLIKKFEAKMNKRVKEFEKYNFKLKDALMEVAYVRLGFDETILPFETLKKDYYRYRINENPL